KVLGSGCANCKRLHQLAELALRDLSLEANLLYVTDMMEIANAGILRTPGLIINNKIVSYGRVPTLDEVKNFIQNAK
ncbi:MAG: thioredoxin family protein, partial [Acholeplasmataceae bacterium]|nr:thioredoxin family protein [Acholeplasmataceae bacterium]